MIDTTIVVTSKSEERKERKERLPRGIRRRGSSLVAYLTKNDGSFELRLSLIHI